MYLSFFTKVLPSIIYYYQRQSSSFPVLCSSCNEEPSNDTYCFNSEIKITSKQPFFAFFKTQPNNLQVYFESATLFSKSISCDLKQESAIIMTHFLCTKNDKARFSTVNNIPEKHSSLNGQLNLFGRFWLCCVDVCHQLLLIRTRFWQT